MFAVPLLLFTLAVSGCDKRLNDISAALRENRTTEANGLLAAAKAQCSGIGNFHELAAVAALKEGNFDKAANELGSAFSLSPSLLNDQALVLWYAQALLETERSGRLTEFLDNHRRNLTPPMLFSLGTLFGKHGDYREAAHCFQLIPPGVADDAVYFNLGLAYSHLQEFERARTAYFQAIDHNSNHAEAYFRVGLDFAAAGDSRKAIPWLVRARQLTPGRPDICYSLVEQLLAMQYSETAKQILDETIATSPQNPLLLAARGDVLIAQNSPADAAASFQSALEQSPKFEPALVGLARVSISQQNNDQARKYLQSALAIEPNDPVANGELGSIELDANELENAYDHLSKSWSLDHSAPTVALHLARALERLNRSAEALNCLQPLEPVMRNSSAYHLELSQVFSKLGRTADAQREQGQVERLSAKSDTSLRFAEPKVYVY